MMRETIIRLYTPADKDEIIRMFRLNMPEFFSPDEEKHLLYYLDTEAKDHYVMQAGSAIVGCGGFAIKDGQGIICWDFFHPAWQQQGLGKRLLQFRIGKMKEQGIRSVIVRTAQMTFRFYEKAGFVLQEVVKDYWARGYDLYRMELSLA